MSATEEMMNRYESLCHDVPELHFAGLTGMNTMIGIKCYTQINEVKDYLLNKLIPAMDIMPKAAVIRFVLKLNAVYNGRPVEGGSYVFNDIDSSIAYFTEKAVLGKRIPWTFDGEQADAPTPSQMGM